MIAFIFAVAIEVTIRALADLVVLAKLKVQMLIAEDAAAADIVALVIELTALHRVVFLAQAVTAHQAAAAMAEEFLRTSVPGAAAAKVCRRFAVSV